MSKLSKLLLALSLCAASPFTTAAPGDLDTAFGGLGWFAWSAPGASGDDICIDGSHSIVVAGVMPASSTSTFSSTQLLRYYPSGLVNFWGTNAVWRPVGPATPTRQRPRLVCSEYGYTVASLYQPTTAGAPRPIDLSLVKTTGVSGMAGVLGQNAVVRNGAPALAHFGGGAWLVGQTRPNGNWWQAGLQRWQGVTGAPIYTGDYVDTFSTAYADIHDVFPAADGLIWAVGTTPDYPDHTKRLAHVWMFDASGNLSSARVPGGKFLLWHDRSAEARRVVVGPGGVVHVAVQRHATASEGPSIALHRITFGPSSFQVQYIADAEVGDLAVDDFGRVVIVGERQGVAFVRRYTSTGALDLTFGQAGERRYGFGSTRSRFNAVAFDAVRRIVVTGRREAVQRGGTPVPEALILARLLSD